MTLSLFEMKRIEAVKIIQIEMAKKMESRFFFFIVLLG